MAEKHGLNPDELLKAVCHEEENKKKGRLKIFLGMAAGVGKTFAMLEEAQRLGSNGVNLVVGVIETHGRQETAERLEGLKSVPLKKISYKDVVFEEMDIDEILRLEPELVLIDELAHSNVPGSRHPKRWQDVIEILDNGINVYTTLNVQHIESLKDVVEGITEVAIRETVPDLIIQAAAFIELIDITTDELLRRLKEGKVYLGGQSQLAASNFFLPDRLTALREIVLRYAAEKIDHDLHGMVSTVHRENAWKPRERLLVAVSHSPHSQKLIRTTRRLAFNLDAPWIALNVNDGRELGEDDKKMLAANIGLARDLGAEVITTSGTSIAEAIAYTARHKGVTQIIIGRPPRKSFFDFLPSYTLLDALAIECSEIDIHVIRQTQRFNAPKRMNRLTARPFNWFAYCAVFLFVLVFSLLNWFATPFIGYRGVGFIFLLGILSLSLFFRAGPIFFASILYAGIWGAFFIPENMGLNEDYGLLLLYLLTATVTGVLTDRVKKNKEVLIKREESAQALYEIAKEIASSPSKEIIQSVQKRLGGLLNGQCNVIIKKVGDGLELTHDFAQSLDAKELAAAVWVFENNKEAGWSTTTLPSSKNLYLPLKGFNEVVGVLSYQPLLERHELTIEEKNFMYTVGQLLAGYVERGFTEERQQALDVRNKIEKIYQSILNLLSGQFERPLENIGEAVKALKKEALTKPNLTSVQLVENIEETLTNLFKVIENLSAMAKLSSGFVSMTKESHSINDLIETCCLAVRKAAKEHKITISIEKDLPLLEFDFSLIELVMCNLVINAIENSPKNSTIEIDARQAAGNIVLSVSDEGKGIPEEMLDFVFEKFYRIPGTESPGLGLGLSIAKTIAEIHGGGLRAQNRPNGGARLSLILQLPKFFHDSPPKHKT